MFYASSMVFLAVNLFMLSNVKRLKTQQFVDTLNTLSEILHKLSSKMKFKTVLSYYILLVDFQFYEMNIIIFMVNC